MIKYLDNVITWGAYKKYFTSCKQVWQQENTKIEKSFGLQRTPTEIGEQDSIAQWDDDYIFSQMDLFDNDAFLSVKQAQWAAVSQQRIFFHERELFINQLISHYHKTLEQKKTQYQTITGEKINQDLWSRTAQNRKNIFEQNMLFLQPVVITNRNVKVNLSLLYWSASEQEWTLVTLITKKKCDLADFYRIQYGYFTFRAVLGEVNHSNENIRQEVFIATESDIENKINFILVPHYFCARKTAKTSDELTKCWDKQAAKKGLYSQMYSPNWYIREGNWESEYRHAIHNLQHPDLRLSNKFIYKKNICNGKVKKCYYFPICKKKYLIKTNPLLGYNQLALSRDCRQKLDSFTEHPPQLNNSMLFKPEFSFLAKKKQLIFANKEKIKEFLTDNFGAATQVIVWFDFETIMSAIPFTNNQLKKSQTPFQVAIIITNSSGKEISVTNLLTQPRNANRIFFKQVVDALYNKGARYVVYNQSTERNILIAIQKQYFANDEITKAKITAITDAMSLIDLLVPFKSYNKESPMVCIKSLNGFYGLKAVLNFIQKHHPEISRQAKVVDYNSLAVSNGLMATICAKQYHYQLISDLEWLTLSVQLKKYCENDVRAMIAIYFFLVSLVK